MAAWLEMLIAIAISFGGSCVVHFFTASPGDWYKSLNKPTWTPPLWVFPVVWSGLYVLMGIASWLVWCQGGFAAHPTAMCLYIIQLALNFAWMPTFFGMKRIDLAFYEISALWVAIAATIVAFWSVDKVAAGLLLPYICWISMETAHSHFIYRKNPTQLIGGSLVEPLHPTSK